MEHENKPNRRASFLDRWLDRMSRSSLPQSSKHRRANKYGAERNMTKRPMKTIRATRRRRNKIARASRKRNTP